LAEACPLTGSPFSVMATVPSNDNSSLAVISPTFHVNFQKKSRFGNDRLIY
jgi:hypothetical protein